MLWVLADDKDLLRGNFADLSKVFGFEAENLDDKFRAVQTWLQNDDDWLLIFDNAETLELLNAAKALLPTNAKGHVLFTTRAQATGSLASVTVDCFDDETGAVFLLRRSKQVAMDLGTIEQVRLTVSNEDWQTAITLTQELGGLALAIDQAGAYIEQTGRILADYLNLYRKNTLKLLKKRDVPNEHPDAVHRTFVLALEKVENRSPLAIEILRDCALLNPDGISEKLYGYCNELELDDAFLVLKDYSLIQRVPEKKLFTVHRLVQIVMKDICGYSNPNDDQYKQHVERLIDLVVAVFPKPEFENWAECEEQLLSALALYERIDECHIETENAASLLNRTGYYLDAKGEYSKAEPLYKRSLAICENVFGENHPIVATSLNNLAEVYKNQGEYSKAELLYKRSLAIRENIFEENHLEIAISLNNLAALYHEKREDNLYQIEKWLLRSLEICKNIFEEDHPMVATSLNNLAVFYLRQGKYKEAEPLYEASLEICKNVFNENHPEVASSLNNVALFYYSQGKYKAAEAKLQKAIAIAEKTLGKDHPHTKLYEKNLIVIQNHQQTQNEPHFLSSRKITRFGILGLIAHVIGYFR